MDILIDKVLDADIVVLATPDYFYNVSSLTKNFIDRTYPLYENKKLQGKKFIYIYVGEDEECNIKKYLDNAMYGFTICHEIKVLGTYPFSAGNIGEFNNPQNAETTIQNIISVIRENLTE
jgi:multimeric flavodoxin WrbA